MKMKMKAKVNKEKKNISLKFSHGAMINSAS
jgi:hypothetical protein